MYQKVKIPEMLIQRDWTIEETVKLSNQFQISQSDVKDVLDFHFKGVADALWGDKTNVEITDLLRFEIKPKPIQKEIETLLIKAENTKIQYKKYPVKMANGLARNQVRVDYLNTKLTNYKNLGNEF